MNAKSVELQTAFLAFGTVSQELAGAFDGLRAQVARLHGELREAREGKDHMAARLAALITGLPGGVLVLDAGDTIVECNPAAVDLIGEPLLGETFSTCLTRALRNAGRLGEDMELRNGRFISVSRRSLHSEGEVVLLTDVTEAHLMQVMLRRQQRLLTLGEFAAGLAHQIRTPLATALLYATQMCLPDRSRADLARCSERTVMSLKQLDRLVSDMLAFAHGGAVREVVSLSALLEQVAQWLRPVLRPGVRLTISTQAPALSVRASVPSLVSAVLNLATNALQAVNGELDLELVARRDGTRALIVVRDNGPGIPHSVREKIFEPFYTTRARGNGIGLAIVKSVVEAHQGTVRLSDTGCGATFVIDLPAEEIA